MCLAVWLTSGCAYTPPVKRGPAATGTTAVNPGIAPRHFWFVFEGGPAPGLRAWMKVREDTWVELFPDGTESRYKVLQRGNVLGRSGTILKKFAGDPDKTLTLNDGSFEAFVPDDGPGPLMICFRYFQNGHWSAWDPLEPIRIVE